MGLAVNEELEAMMMAADRIGIRLEIVGGVPSWEASPGFLHQQTAFKIAQSIRRGEANPDCGGVHAQDVGLRFPDGSVKRPDISIFCRVPDEAEGLVTLIPEGVVEIVSPGYELKDFEIGPSFYLSQGIKDVIVHDPRSGFTVHHRRGGATQHTGRPAIALECGCVIQIP